MIAESLYSQVDANGREFVHMKEIMDHRSDGSAVLVDDAYYVDPRRSAPTVSMTTVGSGTLKRASRISKGCSVSSRCLS
jgi:hypothetical protein